MDETGLQLYCPVCCTLAETTTTSGEVTLECDNCETTFTVLLDPEKIAAHSL